MLELIGINLDSGTMWVWLVLALIAGFLLIIYGGDAFVDSAIQLARITKIPPMVIGATVVSVGTTLPELCVSLIAAGEGQTATAIGNAAGSPLCNTALILALILAFATATISRRQIVPKICILFASLIAIVLFCLDKKIGLIEAIILLAIFVGYFVYCIVDAVRHPAKELDKPTKKLWLIIVLLVVGAIGIAIGANLLVDSVSGIAGKMGVSEQIISLTVVALGTSLPELVTAITSLKKSNPELSMGNIVGANIINLTLVMGLSSIIAHGIDVSGDFVTLIVSLLIVIVSLVIVAVPVFVKGRTYRFQGISLLAIYTAYLGYMIISAVA